MDVIFSRNTILSGNKENNINTQPEKSKVLRVDLLSN